MAKTVVVAMSGGVDSSVAAVLLKRAGFDLIGIFMEFWSEPEKNGLIETSNRCCSPESENRARKVAKILKIPFYVFNFEKEFKKRIVDYFLEGYKKGITPNPCVVCNKEIKFGLLLEKAISLDANYVATGHYARIQKKTVNSQSIYSLISAIDKNKDQSYFLWMLNQNQLNHTLFPIGDYTRKEVEGMAKRFKLPVLNIPKSVEVCFIKTTINDFLRDYLKPKPGEIICLNSESKLGRPTVGKHQGLCFYTIGQRKGIGLSGGPYWVLDKDLKENLLIVTKNEKDLYKKQLSFHDVNWISGPEPKLPLKIKAKIRYRHPLSSAKITRNIHPKNYLLEFATPQRAITPGQSVIFYEENEVLGGGIIG